MIFLDKTMVTTILIIIINSMIIVNVDSPTANQVCLLPLSPLSSFSSPGFDRFEEDDDDNFHADDDFTKMIMMMMLRRKYHLFYQEHLFLCRYEQWIAIDPENAHIEHRYTQYM